MGVINKRCIRGGVPMTSGCVGCIRNGCDCGPRIHHSFIMDHSCFGLHRLTLACSFPGAVADTLGVRGLSLDLINRGLLLVAPGRRGCVSPRSSGFNGSVDSRFNRAVNSISAHGCNVGLGIMFWLGRVSCVGECGFLDTTLLKTILAVNAIASYDSSNCLSVGCGPGCPSATSCGRLLPTTRNSVITIDNLCRRVANSF